MPRKTYYKKRRRKRPSKRQMTTLSLNSSRSIVPDRYRCNLNYADIIHVSSGSSFAEHIFRGNSLFDPDYTGTGHQPLGFDQMAVFYNRYLVKAVGIEITVANTSVISSLDWLVLMKNDVSGYSGSWATAIEANFGSKLMSCSPEGSGPNNKRLKKWYSLNAVTGTSKAKYNIDDRYQSDVTTNPAESAGISWIANSADGTTNVTCDIVLKLTFHCEFFDRNKLSAS